MELDYIENVNGLEEHVVRLYNFNMAEAIHFRALLIESIIEKQQPLDLSQNATSYQWTATNGIIENGHNEINNRKKRYN